jgi:hypothetical protein
MPPLYKYVPFEIPDLSTNEVEVEKEIAIPNVLKDLFASSREGFHDASKPQREAGIGPMVTAVCPIRR